MRLHSMQKKRKKNIIKLNYEHRKKTLWLVSTVILTLTPRFSRMLPVLLRFSVFFFVFSFFHYLLVCGIQCGRLSWLSYCIWPIWYDLFCTNTVRLSVVCFLAFKGRDWSSYSYNILHLINRVEYMASSTFTNYKCLSFFHFHTLIFASCYSFWLVTA